MRRTGFVLFALVALLAVTFAPAFAVTDGVPDGNGHPYVMLLLMDVDDAPAYRCSGTLIAPQVFLTAGHCAGEPGEFSGMRVFTESDVQNGNNTYPDGGGPNSVEAIAWAAHPSYTSAQFFLHDVGVVILATPIVLPEYGKLPAVNKLDAMKTQRGKQDVAFTAVGYGLQKSFPDAAAWKESRLKIRMVAYPRLIQINGGIVGNFSLLLSNNANTGGTCFGDSGGPNFIGTSNVIGGVTSFGMNGTCGGTGGVFRVDRQDVQTFIHDFVAANLH